MEMIDKGILRRVYEKIPDEQNQFKKIVPALLRKGLDNVNLSMFDEFTKRELLNAVGDEYVKKGNVSEAIKAFLMAGNKPKLVSIGDNYVKENLFNNAIDVYKVADNKDKLREVGVKCLAEQKHQCF